MEIRGAILAINPVRKISEKFSVQEIYLDTSSYNNITGDKYENAAVVQNINNRVPVDQFSRGEMVVVEAYLNGRFFTRKDGSSGFMQNFNLKSIERATNTAGQPITIPEEQLIQVELPE